jgi:hypothetical protein
MIRTKILPILVTIAFIFATVQYLAYQDATEIVIISIALLGLSFFLDRSLTFIFPATMILTILFVCPLFVSGAKIAIKDFGGSSTYDFPLFFSVIILSIAVCAQSIIRPTINVSRKQFFESAPKSSLFAYAFAALLLGLAILNLSGGTLLQGNYREITNERYSFVEYATLAILIGFAAARSRTARRVVIVCAAVYLASCFLTGLRLRLIAGTVVLFACIARERIDLHHKLGGVAVILFLFILGWVRSPGFSPHDISVAAFLESFDNRGAVISTFGGGFQSAKWYVYFVDTQSRDQFSGLWFFVGDAIGAVLSRSAIPSGMDVKALVSDTYETPGGGLFVGYFFAYFGIAGVIVASIALAALLIYLKRSRNPMAWPFLIICAAYAPRTLLYDYTVMIKMCLVAFILLKLLKWTTPSSSRVRRRHAVQKTNTPPGWREKEAYGK